MPWDEKLLSPDGFCISLSTYGLKNTLHPYSCSYMKKLAFLTSDRAETEHECVFVIIHVVIRLPIPDQLHATISFNLD